MHISQMKKGKPAPKNSPTLKKAVESDKPKKKVLDVFKKKPKPEEE